MKKPLFVTDKALSSLPITAEAVAVLKAGGLGTSVFSEVDPNPNEGNMADGIKAYLAGGHDGVICFGGGSALDLGKMIALMAHQRKDLSVWDLEDVDDWYTRADASKIAPIIAVPRLIHERRMFAIARQAAQGLPRWLNNSTTARTITISAALRATMG